MTTFSLATVIFLAFALLATAGVYQVTAHFRGHRFAVALAAVSLLFFLALYVLLTQLFATYAPP